MTKITTHHENAKELAKRAFFLAWEACGGPLGLGILQDNPSATEDQVWDIITRDYDSGDGRMSADYVFGRMMKLTLTVSDNTISFYDSEPAPDYQAWCVKYPTIETLLTAANDELA